MSVSRGSGSSLGSAVLGNLHSDQIQAEIRRFESVHPCIYQIYDLLEFLTEDQSHLYQQLRDQIVSIEDAFVNSHEWTLSRSVGELRIGVVGGALSGKTSLVHRYLTGSYTAEESPEGGRFKKEVVLDGQSHLMLIRDEGLNPPDAQFSSWADAVIFVYSVNNMESFEKVRHLCSQLARHRSLHDLPLVVVGTKDSLSESSGRVVCEEEGRRLAVSLSPRCVYYETCAPYGLNVERVFKESATAVVQQRNGRKVATRTPTPTQHKNYEDVRTLSDMYGTKSYYHQSNGRSLSAVPLPEVASRRSQPTLPREHYSGQQQQHQQRSNSDRAVSAFSVPSMHNRHGDARRLSPVSSSASGINAHTRSSAALLDTDMITSQMSSLASVSDCHSASTSHLPTPGSTPTTQRKNRRISNIFRKDQTGDEKSARATADCQMGVGRAIPIKQGQLYKKSSKATLNRDWKKKYVCLYSDGKLVYYTSLKEFMENKSQGKEVYLGLATVRVAGKQKPRKAGETNGNDNTSALDAPGVICSGEGTSCGGGSDEGASPMLITDTTPNTPQTNAHLKKKRSAHRRLGSGTKGPEHGDDGDECFQIVSHDQKRWEFAATSTEERDEWVAAIEQQIERALQAQMSTPHQGQPHRQHAQKHEVQAVRQVPGNDRCADCGAPNPDWASLNLGVLICIQCSGIHRNLGSHISRVRSLELDDWPVEYLAVMQAIGNDAANRLWEHNSPRESKPSPDSSREAKEQWVRNKYEGKRFLPPVRVDNTLGSQIVQAVIARNVAQLSLLLTRAQPSDVNACVSSLDRRTPLHLACSIGSLEMLQLLLWNSADVRMLDEQGRSGVWHALNNGFPECAAVLHTAGLPLDFGMPPEQGSISGSVQPRSLNRMTISEQSEVMRKSKNPFDTLPASVI